MKCPECNLNMYCTDTRSADNVRSRFYKCKCGVTVKSIETIVAVAIGKAYKKNLIDFKDYAVERSEVKKPKEPTKEKVVKSKKTFDIVTYLKKQVAARREIQSSKEIKKISDYYKWDK